MEEKNRLKSARCLFLSQNWSYKLTTEKNGIIDSVSNIVNKRTVCVEFNYRLTGWISGQYKCIWLNTYKIAKKKANKSIDSV